MLITPIWWSGGWRALHVSGQSDHSWSLITLWDRFVGRWRRATDSLGIGVWAPRSRWTSSRGHRRRHSHDNHNDYEHERNHGTKRTVSHSGSNTAWEWVSAGQWCDVTHTHWAAQPPWWKCTEEWETVTVTVTEVLTHRIGDCDCDGFHRSPCLRSSVHDVVIPHVGCIFTVLSRDNKLSGTNLKIVFTWWTNNVCPNLVGIFVK